MSEAVAPAGRINVAWAVAAGLCTSLVGIGLSRFAYTPLIPAVIDAGWFTPADAAYLGAANLAGYLAGALAARPMAARSSARIVLRAMMLLATAAFFASMAPLSFGWFFLWRFASGLAGGALMVLGATSILPHVPLARRGLAGGIIFTGVGLGIVASGTLVPLLLRWGLVETWCGLGALSLLLTLLSWGGLPAATRHVAAPADSAPTRPRASLALKTLWLEYALNAVGVVPHMVFLVDFVARGLGQGLAAGAQCWIAFGVGATAGPVVAGSIADRIGFRAALRLALAIQILAVGLLAVSSDVASLLASSLIVGAAVPGIVSLVLGRIQELARGDHARQAAWSTATIAFAIGQAGAAYALSFLFEHSGSHALLFEIGAAALALALLLDLAVARSAPAR